MGSEIYGGAGFGGGPNRGVAASRVNGPAIGLMATAAIGILLQLVSLAMNILGTGFNMANLAGGGNTPDAVANMMGGTLGVIGSIFSILIGGVIFFGAMKMRQLQNWGLSLAATILAMIPCLSPCCCLGLPLGIWALVVLLDDNVKRSFV
jgi:hypothetical protein